MKIRYSMNELSQLAQKDFHSRGMQPTKSGAFTCVSYTYTDQPVMEFDVLFDVAADNKDKK